VLAAADADVGQRGQRARLPQLHAQGAERVGRGLEVQGGRVVVGLGGGEGALPEQAEGDRGAVVELLGNGPGPSNNARARSTRPVRRAIWPARHRVQTRPDRSSMLSCRTKARSAAASALGRSPMSWRRLASVRMTRPSPLGSASSRNVLAAAPSSRWSASGSSATIAMNPAMVRAEASPYRSPSSLSTATALVTSWPGTREVTEHPSGLAQHQVDVRGCAAVVGQQRARGGEDVGRILVPVANAVQVAERGQHDGRPAPVPGHARRSATPRRSAASPRGGTAGPESR
jgi:hypothetical protein